MREHSTPERPEGQPLLPGFDPAPCGPSRDSDVEPDMTDQTIAVLDRVRRALKSDHRPQRLARELYRVIPTLRSMAIAAKEVSE